MMNTYYLIEDIEPSNESLNKSVSNTKTTKASISDRSMYRFKTILLGNIAVGKTSILSRFVDSKFRTDYVCSVGVEFKVKSLFINDTTAADLQIWDTCGQEKFKTITRQYYRDTNGKKELNYLGCILIFDLTNEKSFKDLETWISDLVEYGPVDSIKIIIGNKSDLVDERIVSFNTAVELARKYEYDYIEVSAKTGDNVKFLFEVLSKRMIKKQEQFDILNSSKTPNKKLNVKDIKSPYHKVDNGIKLDLTPEKKKKKCC